MEQVLVSWQRQVVPVPDDDSPRHCMGETVILVVIGRILHTQGMPVGLGLSGGGAGTGLEVKTGCSRP